MRQNKLFTSIYVAGTALAIATTMIMAIVYYVKIAPIYPEVNRNRTLFSASYRPQTTLWPPGAWPPDRITPTTCFLASEVFWPFWKVISFLP